MIAHSRHTMRALLLVPCLLALGACGTRHAATVARKPDPPAPAPSPAGVAAASVEPVEKAKALQPPAPSATPPPTEPPPPPQPAVVERVAVPGDLQASVVRGPDGAPPRIVFMPGVCSNAYAYLHEFPEAARAHGGIVAIEGDRPCGPSENGFHSFSWDPAHQRARLEAALAAAGVDTIPREGLTLVGYSAGAAIGELIVQLWPERYSRVVLIGSPVDPSVVHLGAARGVVTMSCSLDVPARMRGAAKRLTARGIPATYLEMPGCYHGMIADGERVFAAAFDWLDDNALPPKDDAHDWTLGAR